MKVKKSYGIALCRPNEKNETEILLMKKRYTYHFFEFVFGRYRKNNIKHLMSLFNNMTYSEKLCILNMKFSDMWYKIWLTNPEKSFSYGGKTPEDDITNMGRRGKGNGCYFKKKNKFEASFMRDAGKSLLRMIDMSENAETPWDIPRGRKIPHEKDLDAASREFEEETGITSEDYTILWNIPPVVSAYKSHGTIYKHYFYLATLDNKEWKPRVSFKNFNQVLEVECLKWITPHEVKYLQLDPERNKRMNTILKVISKLYKKRMKL